ncbi:hypothetical protein [Dactylococcopsis salina]|uniref:17 kDa gas vesicle protein n=1 Tax=Dactylococcopsis salina (strain PCC 8305) TaxID=13035 RepID=GVP17_DACS8|nr:hypothetical protein [Dactylococcopsis salina]P81002.2 RecName: Full=17 kDa gas vesicle protein [Dactylococcopsis salina PCC 8305]AFZ50074.1 hypothetical protein Dacsa_1380 [Dactylococcopsis salina PCC 8305]
MVSLREQWNEQARERQREISARKTETVALLQEANQERVRVAQQQKALAIELKNQLAQFHEQLETSVGNWRQETQEQLINLEETRTANAQQQREALFNFRRQLTADVWGETESDSLKVEENTPFVA